MSIVVSMTSSLWLQTAFPSVGSIGLRQFIGNAPNHRLGQTPDSAKTSHNKYWHKPYSARLAKEATRY
jgi:hypothetical protein